MKVRVAEVVRRHEGPSSKSFYSYENFKPLHTLYSRDIMMCRIYALFGILWAKKVLIWVKNRVSWAKKPYYMVHIAYYTELNMQICNYAQNDAFVAKIATTKTKRKLLWLFLPSLKGSQVLPPCLHPLHWLPLLSDWLRAPLGKSCLANPRRFKLLFTLAFCSKEEKKCT